MPYVDVNGVHSHHEVSGDGPAIVLLHGGFCSAAVMRPLGSELGGHTVHAPERPGHGRTPDRPGPMSYAAGVADTLAYLDAVGLAEAHLVGFSDGAIIGLLLARDHPQRVRSLVAISANLFPGDEVFVDREATPESDAQHALLDEEYAALSPDPPGHADDLQARMMDMWLAEPQIEPASLAVVRAPMLVMAGDRDTIALDHTRLIADSVPDARLCVLPGTHLLVRERPALVARIVAEFLRAAGPG